MTCIMTVIIYFFWWNKPLGVHFQTILEPIQTGMDNAKDPDGYSAKRLASPALATPATVNPTHPVKREEGREYRVSKYFHCGSIMTWHLQHL